MVLNWLGRALKQPMWQFCLIGAALFGAERLLNKNPQDTIVVDAERIAWLSRVSTQERGKRPTEAQLQALIDNYIEEEVLLRQALALGLEQDDVIVRRRLLQKVRFFIENSRPLSEPGEAQLQQFYRAEQQRYLRPARLSFSHYYFSSDQRPEARADAQQALRQLLQNHNTEKSSDNTIGDPFMLAPAMRGQTPADIAALFGHDFSQQLIGLEPGSWQGPIASTYGWHLVYIQQHQASAPLSFAEAKTELLKDWRQAQNRAYAKAQLSQLKAAYKIQIESAGQDKQ